VHCWQTKCATLNPNRHKNLKTQRRLQGALHPACGKMGHDCGLQRLFASIFAVAIFGELYQDDCFKKTGLRELAF